MQDRLSQSEVSPPFLSPDVMDYLYDEEPEAGGFEWVGKDEDASLVEFELYASLARMVIIQAIKDVDDDKRDRYNAKKWLNKNDPDNKISRMSLHYCCDIINTAFELRGISYALSPTKIRDKVLNGTRNERKQLISALKVDNKTTLDPDNGLYGKSLNEILGTYTSYTFDGETSLLYFGGEANRLRRAEIDLARSAEFVAHPG